MSKLLIARRNKRRGLLVPMMGTKASPMLLFPLDGVDKSELDELIRAILAKGGVTDEAEINAIIERAEKDSEVRLQVAEAKAEVRRLMGLRAQGKSLMQLGFRKWREAYYPAIKTFKTKAARDGGE